jgi:peptidase M28-like protein
MRVPWLLPTLIGMPLWAQSGGPQARAAETITGIDVMRRVGIIAADSMLGRDTPSRGLDLTAEYVASEFRRMGLEPAGDGGGYIQRFGVTRWIVDTAGSVVTLAAGRDRGLVKLGTDARYVLGQLPDVPVRGPVLLIAGPPTSETAAIQAAKDRIVLRVMDFMKPVPDALNQETLALAEAGAKAVLVLSNRDTATFAQRLLLAARPRLTRDSSPELDRAAPVIELHERALRPVLAAAGIDPTRLRRLDQPEQRLLPGLTIEVHLSRKVLARARVPNVIGLLEGTDSLLRNEYLFYSAHIDHIGITAGQVDSINNGADDNASGVSGLLELAEAFAQPGARPARSIVFLAPSGEEDGLLGSAHFTEHPTLPLKNVVADINMDLIGRNWRDSVIAVGLELSDLGETLRHVTQAHPELHMTPIADRWPEERIFYRSDHYNFARKGVPILFFTSGTHADYHRPSDEPDRIDAEKEARLLRLLFYLGLAVADGCSRPRWSPESYRQIVERK